MDKKKEQKKGKDIQRSDILAPGSVCRATLSSNDDDDRGDLANTNFSHFQDQQSSVCLFWHLAVSAEPLSPPTVENLTAIGVCFPTWAVMRMRRRKMVTQNFNFELPNRGVCLSNLLSHQGGDEDDEQDDNDI